MNKTNIRETANGFILLKDGNEILLSVADFWGIVCYGAEKDARDEIENYLEDYDNDECAERFGISRDKILNNNQCMDAIVEKLIAIRNNAENADDVCDAIELCCKKQ